MVNEALTVCGCDGDFCGCFGAAWGAMNVVNGASGGGSTAANVRRFPKSFLALVPCVQLRFDAFLRGGISFIGA